MQFQQTSTYIDLLLRWNVRVNLTAIRDPEEIVTRHFGESLFLARHLFPDPAGVAPDALVRGAERSSAGSRALDLGSGAGFPGLPLKIWAPVINLTLVESNHKKAAFLREVIRALTLTDVNVITTRAESLLPTHPKQDIVTLRAVEHFETILPTAASLVSSAGRLALLIGTSQIPALHTSTPGMEWHPPIPVPESESRVLSISVPHKSGS